MIEISTFSAWLKRLGLSVEVRDNAGVQELEVSGTSQPPGAPIAVIKPAGPSTWSVIHERRILASDLSKLWAVSAGDEAASATLGQAARQLACGFPLVRAELHDAGDHIVLTFYAPVYEEDLAPQSFLLTVSAVLKAAEGFDLLVAAQTEATAAWDEFEERSRNRVNELEKVISRATPTEPSPGPSAAPSEAPWAPTHTVPMTGIQAWASPDGATPVVAELDPGLPIQLVERRDAWGHVVTSNGWSGWVDARLLADRVQ